jgi:stress-induced morphogen
MPLDRTKILELLEKEFPRAEITLTDLKGTGDYYALTITSEAFNGKTRVQQHQMVYNSLKGYVGEAIHALSLKTFEKPN